MSKVNQNTRNMISDITKTVLSLKTFDQTMEMTQKIFKSFSNSTIQLTGPFKQQLRQASLWQNQLKQAITGMRVTTMSKLTGGFGFSQLGVAHPETPSAFATLFKAFPKIYQKLTPQTLGGSPIGVQATGWERLKLGLQGLWGGTKAIGGLAARKITGGGPMGGDFTKPFEGIRQLWGLRPSAPMTSRTYDAQGNITGLNQSTIGKQMGKGYGTRYAGAVAGAGASALLSPLKAISGVTNAMVTLAKLPFATVGAVAPKLGTAFGKMIGMKPETIAKVGNVLKEMGGGIVSMGLAAVAQVFMQLLDAINPFKPVIEALTTIFTVYGDILSQAFMPLVEQLFVVFLNEGTMSLIQQIAMAGAQLVTAFLPLLPMLLPLVNFLLGVFLTALNTVLPIILSLGGYLNTLSLAFKSVADTIATGFTTLNTWWTDNIITPLTTSLNAGFAAASTWWSTNVTTPLNNAINGAADFGKKIGNFFIGILNTVIGILNAPINTINSWDKANLVEDIPTIPTVAYLANGGIATKPTLAVIGEAGPEAVVPLPGSKGYNPNNGMGGGTVNYYIQGNVDHDTYLEMKRRDFINGVR